MADTASGRSGKATIESVQAMRGLAAFAVVLYHANLILAQPQYGAQDILPGISSRGWLGVNFFFVLSGFIIMVAHYGDIGRPGATPRYLWRRIARVYPIYWICLSAYLLAAYIGIGHPSFEWNTPNILSAYLLVQVADRLTIPLQVAWTLFYEISFYAMFTLLIINRTLGICAFALWLAGIAAAAVFGHVEMGMLHMWNISFFTGIAVFFLSRRMDDRHGLPVLTAGIGLLLALLVMGYGESLRVTQSRPVDVLLLTLPFGMILLGATLAERRRNWRVPGLLMLLGAASYSIYLVHSPVISVIAQLHHRVADDLPIPGLALFALATVVSTAAGLAAHLVLERPMLRWFNRIGSAKTRAAARPLPAEMPSPSACGSAGDRR